MNSLTIDNRQRTRPVNLPHLRRIGQALLQELMNQADFEIAIYLVGAREITRLNETYLRHQGSTDVITFDYAQDSNRGISSSSSSSSSFLNSLLQRSEDEDEEENEKEEEEDENEDNKTPVASHGHPLLHGEIFICLDEALLQARRFRTTWQSELVRYVVHGVLHLSGYTDQQPRHRREMKRKENQLLRQLAHRHNFRTLGGARPQRPRSGARS